MKRIFIQAGILTLFVFLIGIMIGVWLDNFRLASISNSLSESDINSYDARLLNSYIGTFGKNYCNVALEQNLEYNNKIYEDGKNIESRLTASSFSSNTMQEWRRYTLLQTQFWLNSIELKDNCNFTYHTVVHLFRLQNTTTTEEVDNKVQSNILLSLKEKCGNKMMLIPITADSNLVTVGAISKQFNVTEYPAIIIDESHVFQGLTAKDKLNSVIQC
ncbi:MAG: hypothetical protein HYW22_02390 [Candidatus Aenigmarchaeota archaeon]|nr:hypothetical protein [Candidatus Aenigmarchaeota archaeon]